MRVVINGSNSEWGLVISGVPQGSVLGPLLCLIYINGLESENSSDISKFVDDTKKIGRIIRADSVAIALQADLNNMNEWIDRWQMQFNTEKYNVLSVARSNPQNRYTINEALISLECERFRS